MGRTSLRNTPRLNRSTGAQVGLPPGGGLPAFCLASSIHASIAAAASGVICVDCPEACLTVARTYTVEPAGFSRLVRAVTATKFDSMSELADAGCGFNVKPPAALPWQPVVAQYEVYAAEGAFPEDTDTDQWALIGGAGGLELVAEPVAFEIERIVKVGGRVTLDFRSPNPNGPHQVLRSADLKTWGVVSGVELTPTGVQTVRATLGAEGDAAGFYRLAR